jgi:hypothetical protein
MEMSGQLHALEALPLGKRPRVPIGCEAEEPQSCSRHYGEENNFFLRQESNANRSVRSPLLCGLSYRAGEKHCS